MFEYIKGEINLKNANLLAVDVAGIAYRVICSKTTSASFEDRSQGKVYIYTYVREDAITLYGFYTEEERELFSQFISTSGIGAKLAIEILSTYTPEEICSLIRDEAIQHLTRVSGLGTKKAKKLILEIKDKVPDIMSNVNIQMREDIIMGLQALGYQKSVILEKTANMDFNYLSIQEGIEDILEKIIGNRD